MIRSFRDAASEDLFFGRDTKAARRIPRNLWRVARRRLDLLDSVRDLRDVRTPGSGLHELFRDRAGQFAIRINDQYRICFTWTPQGPADVEVTDYH